MSKVWHISDLHLSFKEDGSIQKPMDKRSWSKGCEAYNNYLDKIAEFAKNNITNSDITVITGDIVHDMGLDKIIYSLKWIRNNIPGHIVICRGNHDTRWQVSKFREKYNIPGLHILDEYETFVLKEYMFGCYSDHKAKTKTNTEELLSFANYLSTVAQKKSKTAVFISHYPVSKETAEELAKNKNIKAYLSGHIHCTNNETGNEECVDLTWYNESAEPTDDKTFGNCYFSTATTDLLLYKHGQIFKEIKNLKSKEKKKVENNLKNNAAKAFKCNISYVYRFNRQDPFNENNYVSGFICRKKGPTQGSLYITHINGKLLPESQLILGTPKLAYPYKRKNGREYIEFPKDKKWIVTEKYNGVNILFFKYTDLDGKTCISAKTKMAPFLSDNDLGQFLTLTKKAVKLNKFNNFSTIARLLKNDEIASVSAELCGSEKPHLVKYDFPLALKPLFVRHKDGNINPVTSFGNVLAMGIQSSEAAEKCIQLQDLMFQENERYRKENNLPHSYEYEHFINEGGVLYLTDPDTGMVIDNHIYKIKPKDIEEVHWKTFDTNMKQLVDQAVEKIKTNEEKVSEKTLQEELDMGEKQWSKFGRSVMKYIESGHSVSKSNKSSMVLLCGLPGSGKSTLSSVLKNKGYKIINQDEMGSRKKCKNATIDFLNKSENVVIDRCNFDIRQRKSWLDLAKEYGVDSVYCVWLDLSKEECQKRAGSRKNHPTIKTEKTAHRVVDEMSEKFVEPTLEEGFKKIYKINRDELDINNLLTYIEDIWG